MLTAATYENPFFMIVSPDGKKFYVAEAPQGISPPLTVVTNWLARGSSDSLVGCV
jgi:hypothetical protein